jgi:hypothetical protein
VPRNRHRLRHLFELSGGRVLRVALSHGDIFKLKAFSIVDCSIYGDEDMWSATVVAPVSGSHPDFARLFHAGSGVDFVERDVAEVVDDETGVVLHRNGADATPAG